MKLRPLKINLTVGILIGLLLSSCNLFENEQIPECLRQSREDPSSISHCDQPVYFARPAWHPAGEWIATEHTDSLDIDGNGTNDSLFTGIWLVHAETGQIQPLLPFGDAPAWNPAGTHLAVHAGGGIYTVEVTNLYPARFDTASIIQLTNFNAAAFFPTWSGDGQWLAFDTNYQDEKGANVIWKIRKDGTDLTDISRHQVGEWRFPDWSKSSFEVTYGRYVTGGAEGPEIFIMKADGSGSRQLTESGENYSPKFSPDGEKISYTHQMPYEYQIVVMNSDGGNKKVITNNHSREAAWSPNGKKLVYVLLNLYEAVPGNGQLWVMNADGSNKKQLTNSKED